MEKIINLRKATDLDDIRCYDGELENADFIFGEEDKAEENGGATSSRYSLALDTLKTVPSGAEFLAVHAPEEGVRNIIISLFGGTIAWLDNEPRRLLAANPVKVVGVGRWFVVLTSSETYYLKWNGKGYDIYGAAPGAPEVNPIVRAKALPPYSNADGDLPQINVKVSIGGSPSKEVLDWLAGTSPSCPQSLRLNITEAIKERLREFLADVGAAGLYFAPVWYAAAWRLHSGESWQKSDSIQVASPVGGDEALSLKIVTAGCDDGYLYITLSLSRAPYSVEMPAAAIPTGWESVIAGLKLLVSDKLSDLNTTYISPPLWLDSVSRGFRVGSRDISGDEPVFDEEVYSSMQAQGIPYNIFSIGGKMLATAAPDLLLCSLEGLPMVCAGTGRVAGDGVIHLTQSLRALSSGQFGEFPLYAFCRDGIRALTPSGHSFKDVQLISRDVVCGSNGCAPLPDSTCFVTTAGVLQISGTTVRCLSDSLDYEFGEADRLLYLYRENALILFRPGSEGLLVYLFSKSKWYAMEGKVDARHYSWPEGFVMTDRQIGKAFIDASDETSPFDMKSAELIPVKTRPVKITNAFDIKQLTEIETTWPDGSSHAVKAYGALRLGKWYFLGQAARGHMKMRGSGWRFFRFETFVPKTVTGYLLPQIRLSYK